MDIRFDGKTALVTGAASGIGEAIALDLGRAGARVIVADLHEPAAEKVAAQIRAEGGTGIAAGGDVADPQVVEGLVDLARRNGGLHLLVNNAGIGGEGKPTGDYSLDGWHRVIDVNLNAVFYGLRFGIPAMLDAGGGAIVNMASILGSVGYAGSPAYVAAKHAVVGLTKAAAIDYGDKGIRANAVGPAFIDTPLLSHMPKEKIDWLVSRHPVGRLGTAAEVSALVLFLLSEQASFITGSYHLVDGGYTAP
ncbi:SDR family NAD(P)-dependent oxidoreductase [Paenirhodobacter sp.]|uniref:SDR family NAD(P)-dependent oxidoreductase n=1 Tax=Paenirhodobacter sp. TaxID=1965326 RepID=UPI003B3FE377